MDDPPLASGHRDRLNTMRTVRRLFYADIVSSVAFVAVAFLSLFFFIDFVDELGNVGSRGYTALNAAAFSPVFRFCSLRCPRSRTR